MKKVILALCCLFSLLPLGAKSQNTDVEWLYKWFSAWELVKTNLLSLPNTAPPEMVFYDDAFVYTTSLITAPTGTPITGPMLYGQRLPWRKMAFKDSLTLPTGERVPLGLMSFAGATADGKSFFVMAAPSFWQSAGIESKELTLDKMLIGVFLHEFTHTRQYSGFGTQVDTIAGAHDFSEVPLSDDIVQGYFKKDSNYVRLFQKEVEAFYKAPVSASIKHAKGQVIQGLSLLKRRQETNFTGQKAVLKKLDDIFLSMEGLGQYVAVYWLMHAKGGNMREEIAISGFRRKRNQWSQEEGLAMFLALAKITKPNWLKDQFGSHPKTIVELLEEAVRK